MLAIIKLPARKVLSSHGTFTCPSCKRIARYDLIERVQRRLLFLLIPIQGNTLESYVICTSCNTKHPVDVLRKASSQGEMEIINAMKVRLSKGTSIQALEDEMLATGIDLNTIKSLVRVAAGVSKKTCPQCSGVYVSSILRCGRCGITI